MRRGKSHFPRRHGLRANARFIDLEEWIEKNQENLLGFRKELEHKYIKIDGNTSNVTYQQLVDFVSKPFSKSTLENCIHFYSEYSD